MKSTVIIHLSQRLTDISTQTSPSSEVGIMLGLSSFAFVVVVNEKPSEMRNDSSDIVGIG